MLAGLLKFWGWQGDLGIRIWSAKPKQTVAPHARALPIDYLSFFTSDMFAEMADSCCKTLYFPPGSGEKLPMDMDLKGEYVLRLRNFVGGRNTLLFNGGDKYVIAFLNHYFGFHIKQVGSFTSHAQTFREMYFWCLNLQQEREALQPPHSRALTYARPVGESHSETRAVRV